MSKQSIYNYVRVLTVFLMLFGAVHDSFGQNPPCIGSAPIVSANPSGGPFQRTISVNSNSACSGSTFSLDGSPSWVTVTLSGTILTINVAANTGATRTGTISLKYGPNSAGGVSVTQAAQVVPPGVATGSNPAPRCGSGTVVLNATPGSNANTVRWYSASSGGSVLYTGTEFVTPTLSSSRSYYAESFNISTGTFATTRKQFQVTINPIPSIATGSNPSAITNSGTATLTASPGSNGNGIRWYSAASGGTLLRTGTSYTTPTLTSSRSYYAETYNTSTGCRATTRKKIDVTVNQISCSGASGAIVNANSNGGTFTRTINHNCTGSTFSLGGFPSWMNVSLSGTTLTITVDPYTNTSTDRSGTITLNYGGNTAGGVSVNQTKLLVPGTATGSNPDNLCGSGSTTVSASPGANANTIRWYTATSGGTLLATSTTYTTPNLSASRSYYAESYNSSTNVAAASRKQFTVTVSPIPSIATGSNPSAITNSGTATLTASPGSNGNGIRWYSAASGGTLLRTGTSYTTPTLTSSRSYYAETYNTSTGCRATTRKKIDVTVNQISCNGASGAIVNANSNGGTFTRTINHNCTGSTFSLGGFPSWMNVSLSGTTLTITVDPYTNTSTDRSGTITLNYGGDTAGGVSVNQTKLEVPGTAIGSNPDIICGSGSTTVSATPGANANTIRWYTTASGGSSFSTGPSFTTPNLSSTTSYYAESYNSVTNVAATSRKLIQVVVGPIIGTATGSNPANIENGSGTTTISAAPGTNGNGIRWYEVATGGTALATGPSFTTPTLTTNKQYFAESYDTVSGCTAASRKLFQVTVNAASNCVFADITIPAAINVNAAGGDFQRTIEAACTGNLAIEGFPNWLNAEITQVNTVTITIFPNLEVEDNIGTISLSYGGVPFGIAVEQTGAPTPPSGTLPDPLCGPGDITIIGLAGANGNGVRWYDAPTGGNELPSNGGTFTRLNLETTTSFYAESYNTISNAVSPTRTEFEMVVNPLPDEATGDTPDPLCNPGDITLNAAVGTNGTVVNWYDAPTGGTLVHTGPSFTFNASESISYYAESYNETTGCSASSRKEIQAIVGGEIVWYEDADNDGLGDPSTPSAPSCEKPTGYVANNADQCPDVNSPSNTCNSITAYSSDPQDHNYIYTRAYQVERDTATNFFTPDNGYIQEITFLDGLGRGIQQIGIDQSTGKNDIVTYLDYDRFGRVQREHLPYTAAGDLGNFRTDPFGDTEDYYNIPKYQNTSNPYSEKEFESSPLNRVLKQAAPGNAWAMGNGHEIEFDHQANTAADNVKQYEVSLTLNTEDNVHTYIPTLILNNTNGGYYESGELYKTVTKDENNDGSSKNHSTEEFKDRAGRVILKRTYADVPGQTQARHDTYYVYDDHGNLSYVLPPKIEASTETLQNVRASIDALGYRYVYDRRNRLVIKQIPGKGEEHIIYNIVDQAVMTQDANQRLSNEWLFTKYDGLGRIAYTGKSIDASTRTQLQNGANTTTQNWVTSNTTSTPGSDGTAVPYGNEGYPIANITEILTINYYDNYGFDLAGAPTSVSPFGENYDARVTGLATGTKIRVLDVTPAQWITTVTYYDDKARSIYSYSKNDYLNAVDIVENELDFVGRVLRSRSEHSKNGDTIVTLDNFAYDHVGRLLTQTQCIGDATMAYECEGSTGVSAPVDLTLTGTINTNQVATNSIILTPTTTILPNTVLIIDPNATGGLGNAELIALNNYDELGRLDSKKVGGAANTSSVLNSNGLQNVNYNYNVRNWLMGINDNDPFDNDLSIATADLFAFKIDYENPVAGGTPLYNGNISKTHWRSNNENTNLRTYTYSYDALNRITSGIDNTSDDRYSLSGVSYDKNGNIMTLSRKGHTALNGSGLVTLYGAMDVLSYNYANGQMSNRLEAVSDSGNANYGFIDTAGASDYDYDDNGNMTEDANKGITAIAYNYLNLPTKVTMNGGGNTGTIDYIYDAAGMKLKKIVSNTVESSLTTTEYCGNYVYENNSLQFFSTPEGYVEPKDPSNLSLGYDYIYQYKDHLGNIRLSYKNVGTASVDLEIQEENNYYPFGLKHKGYNGNQSAARNHKYGFGGKEEQDELSLDWLDFSARNYDANIGRWMNLDPLAEQMRRHSPYNYAFDNPVFFVDPDGMTPCPNGDCPDPPKKPEARASLTLGSGKVFGGKVKIFGLEIGFKIDRGTRSVTTSTTGEVTSQVTKGSSFSFAVFGFGTETSTDVTNAPKDNGGLNDSGTKFENKAASFKSTQTESLTASYLFGEGSSLKTTTGTVNIEESTTFNTGKSPGSIVNNAVIAASTSFEPDAQPEVTESIDSKINLFGFEFNAFFSLEFSSEINVPEGYEGQNRGPLYICFVAGTKITMSDGTTKNIEDVENGDVIKSYNLSNNKVENKDVILTQESTSNMFIKIKFKDGTVNINTLTHPYYIKNKGWSAYDKKEAERKYSVKVNHLQVGDLAFKYKDGLIEEMEIESIEIIEETKKTYNLSNVRDNHNFFANGILVHNRS